MDSSLDDFFDKDSSTNEKKEVDQDTPSMENEDQIRDPQPGQSYTQSTKPEKPRKSNDLQHKLEQKSPVNDKNHNLQDNHDFPETHMKSSLSRIFFKGDDLAISGEIPTILGQFDHKTAEREYFTRFYPRDYFAIVDMLVSIGFEYETTVHVKGALPSDLTLKKKYSLYPFQRQAVSAWLDHNKRGTVIVPTGGGKTIIALEIIARLRTTTLIVVPTLVLFEQWKRKFTKYLGIDGKHVGFYGGGDREIKPVTIITYDSAHLYVRQLRDKYRLLILDEAHNLHGKNYEIIADGYLAEYRLALTATLSDEDPAFPILMDKGFSPKVYSIQPDQLVNETVISDFEVKPIRVEIDNKDLYDENIRTLQNYIKSRKLQGNVFQQMIYRVNRDKEAEKALNAYRRARHIAFAADEKISVLHELLDKHRDDKVIIFSDMVSFCERIAREFYIPCITNRTPASEREKIMALFDQMDDAKLVSSKILDEGVDIADASVGIIVAGSSQTRQFIQRLGRILRIHPTKDKAKLYEIISSETMEIRTSKHRKRGIKG